MCFHIKGKKVSFINPTHSGPNSIINCLTIGMLKGSREAYIQGLK